MGSNGDALKETRCCINWRFIDYCCTPSRYKVHSHQEGKSSNDTRTPRLEEELRVSSGLLKIGFNDLKKATRNFSQEFLVGKCRFSSVYKGWIKENGTAPEKPGKELTVAVKTLIPNDQDHKEWLAEVSFLGGFIHPNLVKIIGYCIKDAQRLIVYEFVPRGSLENCLFRGSLPLPFSTRMKIALGIAMALAFLHEEAARPMISVDFNVSSILIDDAYNAKLSNFALAKYRSEEHMFEHQGYAAPEYCMTGRPSTKTDVYSFGIILLVMMTGKKSIDTTRSSGVYRIAEWTRPYLSGMRDLNRLIDPRLEGHFSIKVVQKAAELATRCLSHSPKSRPLMSEVVEALEPLIHLEETVQYPVPDTAS